MPFASGYLKTLIRPIYCITLFSTELLKSHKSIEYLLVCMLAVTKKARPGTLSIGKNVGENGSN